MVSGLTTLVTTIDISASIGRKITIETVLERFWTIFFEKKLLWSSDLIYHYFQKGLRQDGHFRGVQTGDRGVRECSAPHLSSNVLITHVIWGRILFKKFFWKEQLNAIPTHFESYPKNWKLLRNLYLKLQQKIHIFMILELKMDFLRSAQIPYEPYADSWIYKNLQKLSIFKWDYLKNHAL